VIWYLNFNEETGLCRCQETMGSTMILDHACAIAEKAKGFVRSSEFWNIEAQSFIRALFRKFKYSSTSVRLGILLVCIAFAGIQRCDATVFSPPALPTLSTLQPPEFGTSFASKSPTIVKTRASSNAGTPTLITAAAVAAAPMPGLLYCDAPQLTVLPSVSGGPAVDVTLEGDDKSQTFTAGSKFWIHVDSQLTSPDRLAWQVVNFAGAAMATGIVTLETGKSSVVVPCTAHVSGYFAVSVSFEKSDLILPPKGSRPSGIASFGILPDFSRLLPSAGNVPLQNHRFGLQGTNYIQSGKCCDGNGLQPVNQNLGSTLVLESRGWAQTEPNHQGQYDPTNHKMDVGFQQGNLARIVDLGGIPPWASTAPSPTAKGRYPPKSFDEFQAYAAKVGQESVRIHNQYLQRQTKNYYQITWEPNPGPSTQWMGTDSDFVALYQAAWIGLHSTDPDAAVIGPATSNITVSDQWLNRLSALGLSKYLDAVAVHGYYTVSASSSKPPEPADLPKQMQALRHTVTKLFPSGTKLLVTETGISYPAGAKYSATYPTSDVLRQQAEAVVRTHLILLGEGADSSFLFYSADFPGEVGFGLYFNLVMQKAPFGSPEISPKPAAMATATMTRLIENTKTLGALTQMPPSSYGYSFVFADDTHAITALWAHDGTFDANVPFKFAVDIPGSSGSVTIIDGMGNASSKQYLDGKLQITLTEMPTYVFSSNVAALKLQIRSPEGY
jgi:hypothetical protein